MNTMPAMTIDNERIALFERELVADSCEEALEEIGRMLDVGGTHLVMTLNVDQVLNLRTDPKFRQSYDNASLRVLDGMPLVTLARMLGSSTAQRCTGVDLLRVAAATKSTRRLRIALVGGNQDLARRAARKLSRLNSTTTVTAIDTPLLNSTTDPASEGVIAKLTEFAPHLVFIGLGSPKQELWYSEWERMLPEAVYIGSGAAADFAAGAHVRAPQWAQRAGLEWLWRLGQEPARLGYRYLIKGPRFLPFAVRSIARTR